MPTPSSNPFPIDLDFLVLELAFFSTVSPNVVPIYSTPTIPNVTPVSPPILSRSSRLTNSPIWTQDFVCPIIRHNPTTNTSHFPITNFVSYANVSPFYKAFLSDLSLVEPTTFTQASKDYNWFNAIQKEIQALENNYTWSLVPLPPGKVPIGCKWVYKLKYKVDGTLDKYKARLAAKGYTQQAGVDYEEIFSPVVKMVTVRTVLALASMNNWPFYQLDIDNAFLQGNLREEIYMTLP